MQCPVREVLYKQQGGLGLAPTAALDTTTAARINPSKMTDMPPACPSFRASASPVKSCRQAQQSTSQFQLWDPAALEDLHPAAGRLQLAPLAA